MVRVKLSLGNQYTFHSLYPIPYLEGATSFGDFILSDTGKRILEITASATIGPTLLPSKSVIYPNPNWNVAILTIIYFNIILHVQQGGIDILTFNFGTVDPVIAIQSILVL